MPTPITETKKRTDPFSMDAILEAQARAAEENLKARRADEAQYLPVQAPVINLDMERFDYLS